jgi:hypothetical protein
MRVQRDEIMFFGGFYIKMKTTAFFINALQTLHGLFPFRDVLQLENDPPWIKYLYRYRSICLLLF